MVMPDKNSGVPNLEKPFIFLKLMELYKKVKSDTQVAMNKNSDPVQFFSLGWLGRTVAQLIFSKLLELSETSRARKLIFGMHFNRQGQQSQSRRYAAIPGRWYI